MALIKCPECGHVVSDRAPVCPSCGVEIAGNIIVCQECGNIYFMDMPSCPYCHRAASACVHKAEPLPSAAGGTVSAVQPETKKNHTVIIVSFLLALFLVAGGLVFWYMAQSGKEQDAYQYALTSNEPAVLQTYLDTYGSAPADHRDTVKTRLAELRRSDAEWKNALVSGSGDALKVYIDKYPQSIHRQEALHKLDSADWVTAQKLNTFEAYQLYIDAHATGAYIDEANTALQAAQANTVLPEEKDYLVTVFRNFFQSISEKNEGGLKNTVAASLDSFLGKEQAGLSDVVSFMKKIHKKDITGMTWQLNDDFKVDKKEVGDGEYEYTVQFSVLQSIERTDGDKEKKAGYMVKARIDAAHLICSLDMTKILQ